MRVRTVWPGSHRRGTSVVLSSFLVRREHNLARLALDRLALALLVRLHARPRPRSSSVLPVLLGVERRDRVGRLRRVWPLGDAVDAGAEVVLAGAASTTRVTSANPTRGRSLSIRKRTHAYCPARYLTMDSVLLLRSFWRSSSDGWRWSMRVSSSARMSVSSNSARRPPLCQLCTLTRRSRLCEAHRHRRPSPCSAPPRRPQSSPLRPPRRPCPPWARPRRCT